MQSVTCRSCRHSGTALSNPLLQVAWFFQGVVRIMIGPIQRPTCLPRSQKPPYIRTSWSSSGTSQALGPPILIPGPARSQALECAAVSPPTGGRALSIAVFGVIQIGMFRPIRVDHTNCLQVAIKTHSFRLPCQPQVVCGAKQVGSVRMSRKRPTLQDCRKLRELGQLM
jgi:hypothetical protein